MNDQVPTPPDQDQEVQRVEEVGKPKEAPEEKTTAELLRDELVEFRQGVREEAVAAVRKEIAEASKPNRDRVPAPETTEKPSGIRVSGHGTDPLYRSLAPEERQFRNHHIDTELQNWLVAHRDGDYEGKRRAKGRLSEIVRADDILEGDLGVGGGVGDGTGADVVPTPLAASIAQARDIIGKLRPRASRFASPNEGLRIPVGQRATAAMVGEGSTAANSAAGLSTKLLQKKKLQSKFTISDELLRDSAFNVVNHFVRRAGGAIGTTEDVQWVTSDGTGNNITESLESAAITQTLQAATPGTLTYSDMVVLFYTLPQQYRSTSAFFTSSVGMQYLSTLLDTAGRPIFIPQDSAAQVVSDTVPGQTGTIFGRPVLELPVTISGASNDTTDIWVGDLKEYAYLDDGTMRVQSSADFRFDEDVVVWKITERIDGVVILEEAFARLQNISTT